MTKYTALIRTYNSLPLLNDVIDALRKQTVPPTDYVFVDSSSDPKQKAEIKKLGFKVVDYPDEAFNYSKAINIGVDQVETDLVLIISSHVILEEPTLIERGLALQGFDSKNYLGFCLTPGHLASQHWIPDYVDKKNFGMRFAASNSCTMLATHFIKSRPFREDVFSAEDQEWAAHYLRTQDAYFYRVISYDVKYLNSHANDQKIVNEFVALAYFTHRQFLSWHYIFYRILRAGFATLRRHPMRAKLHMAIARELYAARYEKPVKKSKYF